jgi:voltage-gated potassium channel
MPEETPSDLLNRERTELLSRLEDALEGPMLVLAFAWLVLLVFELVSGESRILELAASAIWIVFIVDFAVKFALAPRKRAYLRANWLTAIALLLPALRLARIARIARLLRFTRAQRGMRLLRVLSSLNRGMRALGASLSRRGFGYVLGLTVIVTLAGAAGMYAFERDMPGSSLTDYATALWWTAMIVTTMGSEYWPQSFEGRLLCLLLALYAFAVFGYVTASIATYFVGRDAEDERAEIAGTSDVRGLAREIAALREELTLLDRRAP